MTSSKMFVCEDEIVNGTHFFNFLIQPFRAATEYVHELSDNFEKEKVNQLLFQQV